MDIRIDESLEFLQMRNEKSVRKFLYNQEEITQFVLHKDRLILEVFKENKAVVNLHNKFGFVIYDELSKIFKMRLDKVCSFN